MADLLEEQRRELDKRLAELRPQVEEYTRLEQAAAALDGIGPSPSGAVRRGPGRPRGSGRRKAPAAPADTATATKPAKAAKPRKARAKRSGRQKGQGKRALEALGIVQAQPGITIPEIAAKMKIKQNYLYRVLPGLEKDKKIRKDGRGWHPAS
jgi:hypothetical protein